MIQMLPLELTDVFIKEFTGVLVCLKSSNKPTFEVNFGIPHPQQYHLTSVSSSGHYSWPCGTTF